MINSLFDELKISNYYKSLSKKQKNKFEQKGSWIFKSYRQLLIIAGLDSVIATNVYNYFCSYAHTSSVGLMQTAQADQKIKMNMQDSLLRPFFMATGNYLFHYYEELDLFTMNSEDLNLIETWKSIMEIPI